MEDFRIFYHFIQRKNNEVLRLNQSSKVVVRKTKTMCWKMLTCLIKLRETAESGESSLRNREWRFQFKFNSKRLYLNRIWIEGVTWSHDSSDSFSWPRLYIKVSILHIDCGITPSRNGSKRHVPIDLHGERDVCNSVDNFFFLSVQTLAKFH